MFVFAEIVPDSQDFLMTFQMWSIPRWFFGDPVIAGAGRTARDPWTADDSGIELGPAPTAATRLV